MRAVFVTREDYKNKHNTKNVPSSLIHSLTFVDISAMRSSLSLRCASFALSSCSSSMLTSKSSAVLVPPSASSCLCRWELSRDRVKTLVFGESLAAIPADFDIEIRVEAAGDVEMGGGGGARLAIEGDGGGRRGGWGDGEGDGMR